MDTIHWFISLLQPTILYLVGALSLGGGVCCLCSLISIHREKQVLDNIIATPKGYGKNFYIKEAEKLEKSKSFVFANHLGLRITTLEKAAQKNENVEQDEKGHIKRSVIPGLTDMHELTLHNETGRFCTATMNTIISCLLICGILGTLMGVHNVINNTQEAGISAIANLSQALEPSQWAVGFTIVLIIFRGIYLAAVEQYMSRLDRFTLERLLPLFTPQKVDHEGSADKKMQALSEKIAALGQEAQAVKKEEQVIKKMHGLDPITTSSEKSLFGNKGFALNLGQEEALIIPEQDTAADAVIHGRMDEMTRHLESKINDVQQLLHIPTLS